MSVAPFLIRKLIRRRRRIIRQLIFVMLVIVGLLVWLWPRYFPEWKIPDITYTSSMAPDFRQTGSLTKGTPEYDTILPAGKSIESLGGWTRVSPPEHNDVFAYVDAISGIPISVSEQPLPDELQGDSTSKLEDLAQAYGANRFISGSDGTRIFIGTSSKGPQSLLFIKKDILFLIKSTTALNDEQWIDYIDTLR